MYQSMDASFWVSIALSLVTAGALGLCRFFGKNLKQYKKLLESKDNQATEKVIDAKLVPIYQELDDLRTYVAKQKEIEDSRLALIIASYKFRMIQLCRMFLKQGYLTQCQYDQLTEFYKLYRGLGGNGQAKEYYDRTIILPIQEDPEEE